MADNALDQALADNALADLVEAFGHYSEAELHAFLDATPSLAEPRDAASPVDSVTPEWLAASGFARRETPVAVQAARA